MAEDGKIPISVENCKEQPIFWDNDEKMDSWFAPFRSRELNPLNYDNKMNYWKNNIDFFCKKTNKWVLTLQDVKAFFVRNGKTPSCLSTVFEAMRRDDTILEESGYEEFLANNTWSGWAVNMVYHNPMKWLSKKMMTAVSTTTSDIEENIKYIHLPSVKKYAEDLRRYVTKERKNGLVTYEIVKKIYTEKTNSPVDINTIKLLVQWLVHEKKANVTYEQKHLNTHLLKFSVDSQPAEQIDESEITVYSLQTQEKSLSAQLELYEQEVKDLVVEIKNRLKQGQKNMARSVLRKKKDVEKRIDKVSKTLDNIQTLLYTVEETKSDEQIIKSYQAGAQTLKSKFKIGDLNLNQVDITMSEVDEVLGMHADLQQTLGQSVGIEPNEADLEDELSQLLLNDFPSVPPGPPSPHSAKISVEIDSDLPAVSKELTVT